MDQKLADNPVTCMFAVGVSELDVLVMVAKTVHLGCTPGVMVLWPMCGAT